MARVRERSYPPSVWGGGGGTPPPFPAPLLAYNFTEAGTTATDRTGNGRTATMFAGATPTDLHAAGEFAPTAAGHRLVYNADAAALPTAACSITAKFRTLTLGAAGLDIFGKLRVSDSTTFNLYIEGDVLTGIVRAVGPLVAALNQPGLTSATTYTVALTYDGTTTRLYLNGAQVQTSGAATGLIDMSGDPTWQSGDNPLDLVTFGAVARMDDLRLFNVALTAAEVAAVAATPVT